MVKNDRLTLKFYDDKFVDMLDRWKVLCKFIKGGQTTRIMKLIKEDLTKLKIEVAKDNNLEFK